MAGPPFEAGSILVALRASAQQLQQEVKKAQDTLTRFGQATEQAAKKAATGSQQVAQGFTSIDRATVNTTARVAGFTQRLLALQFTLQTLSSAAGSGGKGVEEFRNRTKGAEAALVTFAGVVSLVPSKIGLIVGAVVGLAILIADLVRQFREASAEVKAFDEALENLNKAQQERNKRQIAQEQLLAQLRLAGVKDVDTAEARLNRTIESRAEAQKQIELIQEAQRKNLEAQEAISERIRRSAAAQPQQTLGLPGATVTFVRDVEDELKKNRELIRLRGEADDLNKRLQDATKQVRNFADQAARTEEEIKLDEAIENAVKVFEQFNVQAEQARDLFQRGLITPAEDIGQQLNLARTRLLEFLKLTEEQRAEVSFRVLGVEESERALQQLTDDFDVAQKAFADFTKETADATALKATVDAFRAIQEELRGVENEFEQGLISPLQRAEQVTEITERRFRELINLPRSIQFQVGAELEVDNIFRQFAEAAQEARKQLNQVTTSAQQQANLEQFLATINNVKVSIEDAEKSVEKGFVDPFTAARNQVQILQNAILALERQRVTLEFDEAGINRVNQEIERIQLELSQAQKVVVDIEVREENIRRFQEETAVPLSRAIGDGVAQGILSGASAMETLAGVGENLFANFLGQSIELFQTGMINALSSIAGAGAGILGGLLTSVAGIAGFFLSGRGEGGVQGQQFAGVQGQVESSQAVRGIVAGPESVAISAVGENLRRALVGVEARLDALIGINTQIRNLQAQRGTVGAAGTPLAGTVPTS